MIIDAFLKFYFYRIYKWQVREDNAGEEFAPATANLFISLFLLLNFVSLLYAYQIVTGLDVHFPLGYDKLSSWTQTLIEIAIPNVALYFLSIHKKKYVKIKEECERKTKSYAKRMTIAMFAYLILSFVFYALTMYLNSKVPHAVPLGTGHPNLWQ